MTDQPPEILRILRSLTSDAPYRAARQKHQIAVVSASHRLMRLCPDERTALILAWQMNVMCGAIELPVLGPCERITYSPAVLAAAAIHVPPPGALN